MRHPAGDATPEEVEEELTKCKRIAMKREAVRFYSQHPEVTQKNILSMGDSVYEYYAAKELAFKGISSPQEHLLVKTIRTKVNPSLDELTYNLQLSVALWPAYVKYKADFDIKSDCDGMPVISGGLLNSMVKQKQHAAQKHRRADRVAQCGVLGDGARARSRAVRVAQQRRLVVNP